MAMQAADQVVMLKSASHPYLPERHDISATNPRQVRVGIRD